MVHAAVRVNEWLEGKFGDRVISRSSDRPWPSCTPDTLNPPALFFNESFCFKKIVNISKTITYREMPIVPYWDGLTRDDTKRVNAYYIGI